MKRIILILICIALLILDNTFAPFIAIYGYYPSFLLVFATSYSIIKGKKEGLIIGVISGLLQDIFFFQGFGVNALVNMWICYVVGIIGEGIWKDKRLIPIVSIFLSTIAKFLITYLIMYLYKIDVDLIKGVYVAIYNSILTLITYKLVYKFYNEDGKEFSWRVKY
ncbi:MAG: rod shape-determining protein MreD [Clostridiales bacterium]|nr:rod shape-determining protein MreD [Clostridiales bacterium]